MADNQTIVLRVQLDEADTEKRLAAVAVTLADTRKQQQELQKAYGLGKVSADEFGQQSVKLASDLRNQQTEQRGLTKTLDLYRTASGELADTYKGQQAQLSLAQIQYQQLQGSQNNSTESTKALSATIAELRGQLLATDAEQGLFVRNLGNYPKGEALEPLLQKLVLLQEVQKRLPEGSEQAKQAATSIGFAYGKLNESAAAAGLTQQDVNNKLADYGERLRPATAELAQLTIAQDEVARSAGKDSEAYTKIGFAIGKARTEIEKVPPTIKQVNPAATAATKALNETATKGFALLGEQGERAAGLLGKFKSGTDLLNQGMSLLKGAGETGSLGFKALAQGIALTGIGLFLIAISAVVTYFTQTAAGGRILNQVLGGLGAVVNLLISDFAKLGEFAIKAVTNPKGAFEEFTDYLKTVATSSVKGYAVLLEGITHLSFSKTFDGIAQITTGTENATDKILAYGKGVSEAAKAGAALAAEQKAIVKARQELDIEDAKSESRVRELLRLSKERGKTSQEQLQLLDEASREEKKASDDRLALLRREQAAIEADIKQRGELKAADLKADLASKLKEIAQAEGAEKEINAKITVRRSTFLEEQRLRELDSNKALYEARAAQAVEGTQAELNARIQVMLADRARQLAAVGLTENQRAAIIAESEKAIRDTRRNFAYTTLQQVATLEQLDLDRRLKLVQVGSQEELDIQRQKLTVQQNLELSAVGLTVRQAQAIREKYEADVAKLESDSLKARALAAYDAELATVNAELTLVKKGTTEETELRVEAINTQLAKELAALDKRTDNTAKAAQLRANAEKAVQDTRYAAAAAATEKFIQGERNALDEQLAAGKISQAAYDKQVLDSDVQAAQMRLNVAKGFGQQTDALDQKFTEAKIAKIKSVTDADRAEQEKRIDQARTLTGNLVDLFQETITTTGEGLESFSRRALVLLIDSVEKSVLAAEIEIIAKSFASWDSISSYGIAGYAKSAAIIAAVAGASEILKSHLTAPPKQFAQGTVLGGPSHLQGGVQLYSRSGHHWGEAEGDEVVLTKGVWQNPLLRPLASQLNVLGGGRPLMPSTHMALGGIIQPAARAYLQQQAGQPIDYERLAQAMARALRQSPPVTLISDVKAGLQRDQQTQDLANS